jgi:hypothetical protein
VLVHIVGVTVNVFFGNTLFRLYRFPSSRMNLFGRLWKNVIEKNLFGSLPRPTTVDKYIPTQELCHVAPHKEGLSYIGGCSSLLGDVPPYIVEKVKFFRANQG